MEPKHARNGAGAAALRVAILALITAGGPAGAENPEGLWKGLLLIEPAAIETEFAVELARGPSGAWVGVHHQPDLGIRNEPLDRVEVESGTVRFEYLRQIPQAGLQIPYLWTGRLSPAGDAIEGTLEEGDVGPVPFVLRRAGAPGAELVEPPPAEVTVLSPGAAELRQRFDADRGAVRVLVLLSPKCGSCLAAAGVIQRYLLETVDDPAVRVYAVWGPMLGHESAADAGPVASRLADPRAVHFWTSGHELAADVARAQGLDRPAWSGVLVYGRDAAWGEAPPAAESFRRIAKGLPAGRGFHGVVLAEEVRALLAGTRRVPARLDG